MEEKVNHLSEKQWMPTSTANPKFSGERKKGVADKGNSLSSSNSKFSAVVMLPPNFGTRKTGPEKQTSRAFLSWAVVLTERSSFSVTAVRGPNTGVLRIHLCGPRFSVTAADSW